MLLLRDVYGFSVRDTARLETLFRDDVRLVSDGGDGEVVAYLDLPPTTRTT
ncbi:hypothetical protein [Persicimonas caeni]|uniref:hypothetical protein n=1 Tax=Persicimonas caeni TaxID=2292766 RepID=UPI001FE6EE39|nr:hypothetical protein [Persicimonas caeni]